MAISLFRPHGDYKAYVDGRILRTYAIGIWNSEMQREAQLQSAPLIASLEKTGPWGICVTVVDNIMAMRSVLDEGRRSVESAGFIGLKALAWAVSPDLDGYSLMISEIRGMYSGIIESNTFDTEAEAIEWLRSRISYSV